MNGFGDGNDDDGSWFLADEYRQLKSGGGRGGSSSSRGGSRSYGNCYGDRCDNSSGSSTQLIVIICSVVGGCCFILGIYCLYHYCKQKIKDKRKRERRAERKRNNQVTHSDWSESDVDPPIEPIVIMPPPQG